MNRIPFLIIFVIGFFSCEKQEFDCQGSKTERTLFSNVIDDDFNIYTYLPVNYDPTAEYPVIFLLDGDWYFEDFVLELNDLIQGGQIEPSILIGIGYQSNVDEKRFRDYTFLRCIKKYGH